MKKDLGDGLSIEVNDDISIITSYTTIHVSEQEWNEMEAFVKSVKQQRTDEYVIAHTEGSDDG